jgi:hypothetical protein
MKKSISCLSVAAFLSIGLFFSSCKKSDVNNNDSTATEAELKTQSDDQERFTSETDAVTDDANASLENSGTSNVGETPQTPELPHVCDFTVAVDTVASPRTITLTYTGAGCLGNRTRTGKVVLSFSPNFRWAQAGSSYTVTYQNLKITRNGDGKAITLNGTKTITNISGGKLRNLATRGSAIIHEITSSNMSVTFDNGTQRTWQIAKRRTFTYDNGIVIAVSGVGTASAGLAEWGINRFGKEFTNSILEPLVIKQSCDFRLVSGKTAHTVGVFSSSITFGLDANGAAVTTCPAGAFYYKAVWTGAAGNTYTVIAPY